MRRRVDILSVDGENECVISDIRLHKCTKKMHHASEKWRPLEITKYFYTESSNNFSCKTKIQSQLRMCSWCNDRLKLDDTWWVSFHVSSHNIKNINLCSEILPVKNPFSSNFTLLNTCHLASGFFLFEQLFEIEI